MKSNRQFEYLSTDGTYKQVYSPDNPPCYNFCAQAFLHKYS